MERRTDSFYSTGLRHVPIPCCTIKRGWDLLLTAQIDKKFVVINLLCMDFQSP